LPELHFIVRWPDDSVSECYSPSLVLLEQLEAGASYPIEDFVARVRVALTLGSERVHAKYGFACAKALGQLEWIEAKAASCMRPEAQVRVEAIVPPGQAPEGLR